MSVSPLPTLVPRQSFEHGQDRGLRVVDRRPAGSPALSGGHTLSVPGYAIALVLFAGSTHEPC